MVLSLQKKTKKKQKKKQFSSQTKEAKYQSTVEDNQIYLSVVLPDK